MISYESTNEECTGRETIPPEAEVEETPAGSLVWMVTSPGVRELLGFAAVEDWDAMANELRKRGIAHGAVRDRYRFPVFQVPE